MTNGVCTYINQNAGLRPAFANPVLRLRLPQPVQTLDQLLILTNTTCRKDETEQDEEIEQGPYRDGAANEVLHFQKIQGQHCNGERYTQVAEAQLQRPVFKQKNIGQRYGAHHNSHNGEPDGGGGIQIDHCQEFILDPVAAEERQPEGHCIQSGCQQQPYTLYPLNHMPELSGANKSKVLR